MVLVGQLALQQVRLRGCQEGNDHRHRGVPPRQRAQIRLRHRKVARRKVHFGHHAADCGAMGGCRGELAPALEPVDHGRRLAIHGVQQASRNIHRGLWHRYAVMCQMFHQAQVKRQL